MRNALGFVVSWESPTPTIPNPGPVLGFFYATWSDVETNANLTDQHAAWLAETIAKRREQFAGWTMELDPADPGADPVDPPAADPADPPADPADDPADESDPRVKRANAQAAKYRTDLRTAQTELAEQGKTLAALAAVFNPGSTETDPVAQLEQITTEATGLRDENAQLRSELLVFQLAGDHNANPTALLDSRAFANTLHGLDPAAEDYRTQVADAIKAAVAGNATLQTAGQGPSRGGAAGAGQGAAQPAGAVTQEQFDGMGYADRSDLFRTNPDLYRRLAGTAT